MASTYPGSLDAFDTIASDKKTSDSVGGRTHRDMHNDLGDAVEAVQAELGTDPAGSYSTVKARLDALVAYAAKTGTYTATVSDHTLNVTSGTFTLSLPAATTCAGQTLQVKNSGTGVVTLDGNSSETVEGVATYPIGPGCYVAITSTGSAWILTGGVPDTGRRNVVADIDADWAANASVGYLRLQRIGERVYFEARLDRVTASGGRGSYDAVYTVPSGFAPRNAYNIRGLAAGPSGAQGYVSDLSIPGRMDVWFLSGGTWAAGDDVFFTAEWYTNDAWPTSLPGSAV